MPSAPVRLSRRLVLQLLSAGAVAGGAAACSTGASGRGTGGGGAGGAFDSGAGAGSGGDTATPDDTLLAYEEVLAELQTHVRAAGDHRGGQARALVENGDPEAILAFVRDQIVWHPGDETTPYNGSFITEINREGSGSKYGPRGALRAGGGSALDRARLLRDLLVDAGFADATLAWFDLVPMLGDDPARLFVRAWTRPPAELTVPDEDWARWGEALGVDLDSLDFSPEPDPGADGAPDALADMLLAHFDDPEVPDRSDEARWGSVRGAVPVVRFTDHDGAVRIANPALPEATLDAPGTEVSSEVDAPEDPGAMEIAVKLSVRTTTTPDWRDETVLVEGTFNAEQLMGRQLLVSTSPVTDTQGLASIPAALHHTFQTALLVQALDDGDSVPEPIVGDAISLGGERIWIDEDGAVRVDDAVVSAGEDGPRGDPEAVTHVRLEVDGTHFPAVFARAWPTDAAGAVVEHLQADQFRLEDEGRQTPVLVQANRAVPRAIILRDTSLSMPAAFRDAAGDAVMAQLTAAIESAWPGASIVTQTTGSNLWENLSRAASQGANVVIYLTDGDVSDDPSPEREAALQAGPPAILVAVGDASEEPDAVLVQMAELTGGVVVPVADAAATEAAVVDTLRDLDLPPYQLRWVVPAGETGERLAVLQVGAAEGEGLYEARPDSEAVRLMALDLELTMEGRTLRRTLAGWPGFRDYPDDRATRDQLHAEVHLALLGGQMLSFEGDGPSPSMVLDDLITVRRASLPLLRTADLDLDGLLSLVAQGFPSLPGPLVAAWQPLQETHDDESLTFPGAMRVTLVQMRPKPDGQEWATLDLVDLSRWRTVTRSGDARENFELNLRRTARLAVMEHILGDRSTISLLEGQPLQQLSSRPFRDTAEPEITDRWEGLLSGTSGVRIGPEDGTIIAYFHSDADSGALGAVMPDGSGGADQILELLTLLDALIHLYCAAAGAGPGLAVASAYGITLARLYVAVAVALEGFVTAGLDEEIRCALEAFACEALVRINAPPLLKAVNRFCGMTLGLSICGLVADARDC